MRPYSLLLLAAVLVTGCTDDGTCIYGVCAGDADETRTFPGPCAAASTGMIHDCTFAYTAANQLDTVGCKAWGGLEDELYDDVAVYRYDSAGSLATIDITAHNMRGRWTWLPSTVEVTNAVTGTPAKRFDRSMFAFMPGGFLDRLFPRAELGLIQDDVGTYTWTRDGNDLERHGSTGSLLTFRLDDAGRLIKIFGAYEETLTYDGDRLASADGLVYRYDRGGNMLAAGNQEVYDYSCW